MSPTIRDIYGVADVRLPTAAEAARQDERARSRGVAGAVLMESAGRAAAAAVQVLCPGGRVVVVAGSGHNGGDGLVLARTLHAWGRPVRIVAVGSRADRALLHGYTLDIEESGALEGALATADVAVDAVLGTGAHGAPRGPAAAAIEALIRAGRTVVALDLPSGIDASTGAVPGHAVRAHLTVAFGWPKLGMLLHPARAHCGRLLAVEIGFPPLDDADFGARAITPDWARARLRPRAADAHKGDAGRLLIVAGAEGMAGAASLTAVAAAAAGAGLIRVVSHPANREVVQTLVPDAVFVAPDALAPAAGDVHAVVAGPGLGTSEWSRALLRQALEATPGRPLLLDADALNLLAAGNGTLAGLAEARPLLLTPHPGEMGRLLDATTADVAADRVAAAREGARRFGCAVLLKGQPSVVAAPGRRLLVNTPGSADLAAAGMGDHLSGVIGALLAEGHPPRTAAALGLFYSSRAADLAALGRSLRPGDVSDRLARAFADPGAGTPPAGLPFVTFDQPAP